MYPGTPGVEEIRIDSSPTAIAVAEVGGLITVTANTTIYNHTSYYDQTVPPGAGPATVIDRGSFQGIEIHGESGNDIDAIIATQTPVTIFSGAQDNITVGDAIRGGVAVVGSAGGTSLTVSDYGDAAAHAVSLDGGSITGMTPAAVTYAPSQVSSLTPQLGGGRRGLLAGAVVWESLG
jgi:hypothetical protein